MSGWQQERIRNFSIIAHIDHGKSTLADRFIQQCGGLAPREMQEQVLDSMALERERGITIKAQSVALTYSARDGLDYRLNMIDTPGHVDFSYEVSRSLTACEGALLVVDASQGVQAQTVANCYTAAELNLTILPVLNKIDLPAADPQRAIEEIEDIIGIEAKNAIRASAKTGAGVVEILESIVAHIPPPRGTVDAPLKALIIDSWFDNYLGTISLVRLIDGQLAPKDRIRLMATGRDYVVDQVGIFTPKLKPVDVLGAGEVGYIVAGIKDVRSARVGDTITHSHRPAAAALPGFKEIKPRVFAGLYPVDSSDYDAFRDALSKLSLNDRDQPQPGARANRPDRPVQRCILVQHDVVHAAWHIVGIEAEGGSQCPLRVQVNQQDTAAHHRQGSAQVSHRRRLADPSFLIGYHNRSGQGGFSPSGKGQSARIIAHLVCG